MREYASKRKIIILIGVVLVTISGVLISVNIPKQDLNKEANQSTNSNRTLAIYIEEDGGEYRASSDGKFPKDGYVLDTEKSTCENGGILSQDPETKKISLRVGNKTKCSLYFKKEPIKPVKGSLAEKLINQANDVSITDYNLGVKGEMYTFSHPATSQTEALTDYRYIGNEPNNYIQFNNEIWRIIGVFTVEGEGGEKEQRIKIIRDESIGNIAWVSNNINEWPTSTLSILLNSGDYYNRSESYSSTGLTETAISQIAPAKWYLGGNNTYQNLGGPHYYNFERGTTVIAGRSTNVIANVGLMYPSDYVYTYVNGVDNTCYTDGYNCKTSASGTPSAGWLFNSNNQWTITLNSSNLTSAFLVRNSGYVDNRYDVYFSFGVRPSAYLRSDIEIASGTGAENDPYILKA